MTREDGLLDIETPEGHIIKGPSVETYPDDMGHEQWCQLFKLLGCRITPGNKIRVLKGHETGASHLIHDCIIACSECGQPVTVNKIAAIMPTPGQPGCMDYVCSTGCLILWTMRREDRIQATLTGKPTVHA